MGLVKFISRRDGEGAMPEPSEHLGEAYLAAFRRGIASSATG
jgi:hypothetical protein